MWRQPVQVQVCFTTVCGKVQPLVWHYAIVFDIVTLSGRAGFAHVSDGQFHLTATDSFGLSGWLLVHLLLSWPSPSPCRSTAPRPR
jgi:hypothetical protein